MRFRPALAKAIAIAAFVLALSPGQSRADTVNFIGNSTYTSGVSYSGSLSVTVGSATSATIQISLTNTSTGTVGPATVITGFGISLPTGATASAASTGSSTDANFHFLEATTPGVQISLQSGNFPFAFSTDATQLHTVPTSTEVSNGLQQGQSATFTINVTGTGLGSLTAAGVLKALSAPSGGTPGVPFDVRFRSLNTSVYTGQYSPNGDKVPYSSYTTPTVTPHGAVPAPAGLVLGIIGVGCMLGRSLRRRTAAAVVA